MAIFSLSRSVIHPGSIGEVTSRRLPIALPAIIGGVLTIVGALLPWFTLFAGLHAYPGILGLNGQLLAAGGALSIIGGAWFLARGGRALQWGIGLLGFTILAFSSMLLLRMLTFYQELASNPLSVPALGPGLFLIVAGGLLIFAALLVGSGQKMVSAPGYR